MTGGDTPMASVVTLIAALITCVGTVAAALITTRQRGPAGTVQAPATIGGPLVPVTAPGQSRVSRCLWCGIAGLFLWVIPVLAYVVVLPGVYVGIRDVKGPRRHTALGLALCSVSLFAALCNSAAGAYAGAHGAGWWQQ